jgi:lipoate-protein ligase B
LIFDIREIELMNHRGYIIDLGLIDYKEAWELQHHLWAKRVAGELPDLLLLSNISM